MRRSSSRQGIPGPPREILRLILKGNKLNTSEGVNHGLLPLFFCYFIAKTYMLYGSLLELSCIEICKMEADLEVSVLELYYSAKFCIRKYKKESVCTNVAIKSKEHTPTKRRTCLLHLNEAVPLCTIYLFCYIVPLMCRIYLFYALSSSASLLNFSISTIS